MYREDSNGVREEPWAPRNWSSRACQKLEKKKVESFETESDHRTVRQVSLRSQIANLFDSFNMDTPSPIATNARKSGIQQLKTLQNIMFHNIYSGRDISIAASAASGKTMGYLIPLLQKVMENLEADSKREENKPRALIVVPTQEHMLFTFKTAMAIAASTPIRISMYSWNMDHDWKDMWKNSDVVISTDEMMVEAMFGQRNPLSMEKTMSLVFDGIEDLQTSEIEAIMIAFNRLEEKPQLILVANDVEAVKSEYWNKIIASKKKMVALTTDENQRLSPCNHSLLRVNSGNVEEAVLRLIRCRNNGPIVVVIGETGNEPEDVLYRIQVKLKLSDVTYYTYRTELSMNDRESIIEDILKCSAQVLLVKYCKELKGLKLPGVVEVIHVGLPPDFGYVLTTSMVAFKKNSRSVVLVNVDEKKPMAKELGAVVMMIQKSTISVDWASANPLPDWAQALLEYHEVQEVRGFKEDRPWDLEDVAAAKMLSDVPVPDVESRQFPPNIAIQKSIAERGGARRGGARREGNTHCTKRNCISYDKKMAQEQPTFTRRRVRPTTDPEEENRFVIEGIEGFEEPMQRELFGNGCRGCRRFDAPQREFRRPPTDVRSGLSGPNPFLCPLPSYSDPAVLFKGPLPMETRGSFIANPPPQFRHQMENRRPVQPTRPPQFRHEKAASGGLADLRQEYLNKMRMEQRFPQCPPPVFHRAAPARGSVGRKDEWPVCCPGHMMNPDWPRTLDCSFELRGMEEAMKRMNVTGRDSVPPGARAGSHTPSRPSTLPQMSGEEFDELLHKNRWLQFCFNDEKQFLMLQNLEVQGKILKGNLLKEITKITDSFQGRIPQDPERRIKEGVAALVHLRVFMTGKDMLMPPIREITEKRAQQLLDSIETACEELKKMAEEESSSDEEDWKNLWPKARAGQQKQSVGAPELPNAPQRLQREMPSQPPKAQQLPSDDDDNGITMGVKLTSGQTINVLVPEDMIIHMWNKLQEKKEAKKNKVLQNFRDVGIALLDENDLSVEKLKEAQANAEELEKTIINKETLLKKKEELLKFIHRMKADHDKRKAEKAEEEEQMAE